MRTCLDMTPDYCRPSICQESTPAPIFVILTRSEKDLAHFTGQRPMPYQPGPPAQVKFQEYFQGLKARSSRVQLPRIKMSEGEVKEHSRMRH